MECGDVPFPKYGMARCAALKIEEPHSMSNSTQERRYVSHYSGDQVVKQENLRNRMHKNPMPKDVMEEYDRELQTCLDNDWLLPYPEMELGPPRGIIPLIAVMQKINVNCGQY